MSLWRDLLALVCGSCSACGQPADRTWLCLECGKLIGDCCGDAESMLCYGCWSKLEDERRARKLRAWLGQQMAATCRHWRACSEWCHCQPEWECYQPKAE